MDRFSAAEHGVRQRGFSYGVNGMLVLARKVGEKIFIGEGENAVVVTITAINGERCKVGIDAPNEVKIIRRELVKGEEE
jgi:carbon storage regulator CsrA